MGVMASQITSLMIVYSTAHSAKIKENIKAPRHRPLCGGNSPHKWSVARKMFPFDDVIILLEYFGFILLSVRDDYHTSHSWLTLQWCHMNVMQSQINGHLTVCFNRLCGPTSKTHQSPTYCLFVRGIHRWPVYWPHKGPVTQKKSSIWYCHHAESSEYVDIPSFLDAAVIGIKVFWQNLLHWLHCFLGLHYNFVSLIKKTYFILILCLHWYSINLTSFMTHAQGSPCVWQTSCHNM